MATFTHHPDVHHPDEPSKAASVVPVLLAFGALLVATFAAAYFGRAVIDVVGTLLGAS